MAAVLEEAVATFQRNLLAKTRRGQRLFREVDEWIRSADTSWTFAFESVCHTPKLDPKYLRAGLERLRLLRVFTKQPTYQRRAAPSIRCYRLFSTRRVHGRRPRLSACRLQWRHVARCDGSNVDEYGWDREHGFQNRVAPLLDAGERASAAHERPSCRPSTTARNPAQVVHDGWLHEPSETMSPTSISASASTPADAIAELSHFVIAVAGGIFLLGWGRLSSATGGVAQRARA